MAGDRRYKEIVPEPIRRFEADHFEQPSDWYIRSAANVGVYLEPLEEALPSSLLDDPDAAAMLRQRLGHPQAGGGGGEAEQEEK